MSEKKKQYKRLLQSMRKRKIQLMKRITPAEREMMNILKYLNVYYKFQKPFFHRGTLYIVDFFLPQQKMVIEVDGSQHNYRKQRYYDERRTEFLETKRGVKVIRFTNSEILRNPNYVIEQLESLLQ
jgi:very-short-patch-repair endonuclease